MATPTQLMAASIPWLGATMLGSNTTSGIDATGASNTKAAATMLPNAVNLFATAPSTVSYMLPPAGSSPIVIVYNGGVSSVRIFANGTETINALPTTSAFSVVTTGVSIFIPGSAEWVAIRAP